MARAKKPASMNAHFDPKTATPDSVHKAVEYMLRQAGCTGCGRLSQLALEFVTNPADTKIPGVTSIQNQG